MLVKTFDDREAEKQLKTCPKIVRDYVKLLHDEIRRKEDLVNKAIQKLREK